MVILSANNSSSSLLGSSLGIVHINHLVSLEIPLALSFHPVDTIVSEARINGTD